MTRSTSNWKALILAAGFGTRLLPYTRHTPKPLFTIDNTPVIDLIIDLLIRAGCGGIVINTHHLHEKIEAHFERHVHVIPVLLSHEPEILGTGGAIKNNADFFGRTPFLVINSDIHTTIDPGVLYRFHCGHDCPITLAVRDDSRFNTVTVDDNDNVIGFDNTTDCLPSSHRRLTFTGIQVMDPEILDAMPEKGGYCDIIDVYRRLIDNGVNIKARLTPADEWDDIGTPAAYRARAFDVMARKALRLAFGEAGACLATPIPSDGSDTRWTRLVSDRGSIIACDRDIGDTSTTNETASLACINRHLFRLNIAVPELYAADPFAGLAFMADLGDTSLQSVITVAGISEKKIIRQYKPVLEQLVRLATAGARGFDPSWTCQTERYDKELIIERECRYFMTEFPAPVPWGDPADQTGDRDELEKDFSRLADVTLASAIEGLIHRDMQSRNIMIHQGRPWFIDIQGARFGPVQYDLASLLIDPYTALPTKIQNILLNHYQELLSACQSFSRERFLRGYACCAVTRNLQILGAFGFLTRRKGKSHFAPYLQPAAAMLAGHVRRAEEITGQRFPRLLSTARRLRKATARQAC